MPRIFRIVEGRCGERKVAVYSPRSVDGERASIVSDYFEERSNESRMEEIPEHPRFDSMVPTSIKSEPARKATPVHRMITRSKSVDGSYFESESESVFEDESVVADESDSKSGSYSEKTDSEPVVQDTPTGFSTASLDVRHAHAENHRGITLSIAALLMLPVVLYWGLSLV